MVLSKQKSNQRKEGKLRKKHYLLCASLWNSGQSRYSRRCLTWQLELKVKERMILRVIARSLRMARARAMLKYFQNNNVLVLYKAKRILMDSEMPRIKLVVYRDHPRHFEWTTRMSPSSALAPALVLAPSIQPSFLWSFLFFLLSSRIPVRHINITPYSVQLRSSVFVS